MLNLLLSQQSITAYSVFKSQQMSGARRCNRLWLRRVLWYKAVLSFQIHLLKGRVQKNQGDGFPDLITHKRKYYLILKLIVRASDQATMSSHPALFGTLCGLKWYCPSRELHQTVWSYGIFRLLGIYCGRDYCRIHVTHFLLAHISFIPAMW